MTRASTDPRPWKRGPAADQLTAELVKLAAEGYRPICGTLGLAELSTSDDHLKRAQAAAMCHGCRLFSRCAAAADENRERFGVWAGVDRGVSEGGRNPDRGGTGERRRSTRGSDPVPEKDSRTPGAADTGDDRRPRHVHGRQLERLMTFTRTFTRPFPRDTFTRRGHLHAEPSAKRGQTITATFTTFTRPHLHASGGFFIPPGGWRAPEITTPADPERIGS